MLMVTGAQVFILGCIILFIIPVGLMLYWIIFKPYNNVKTCTYCKHSIMRSEYRNMYLHCKLYDKKVHPDNKCSDCVPYERVE